MKENFVTYFDKNYLPRGLCLYNSLVKQKIDFVLWIVCTDEVTYKFFEKNNLQNIKLVKLEDIENNELLNVKKKRNKTAYFWTITAFCIDYILNKFISEDRVTYLDADIYFFKDPTCIFDEFEESNKDVLITKHSYAPELDLSKVSGHFCVQFIIFKKGNGQVVLEDWKKSCLNWCSTNIEDGKFGDQMYLNDWPLKFKSYIHILGKESFAMGPWNALRYPFSDAIFYHFHGIKIVNNKTLFLGLFDIPERTINNLYKPYVKELKENIKNLNTQHIYPASQITFYQISKEVMLYIFIKIYKKLNFIKKITNKFLHF